MPEGNKGKSFKQFFLQKLPENSCTIFAQMATVIAHLLQKYLLGNVLLVEAEERPYLAALVNNMLHNVVDLGFLANGLSNQMNS